MKQQRYFAVVVDRRDTTGQPPPLSRGSELHIAFDSLADAVLTIERFKLIGALT